ncbi:MAG: tyrosine-type recombinase/integrase [Eubacteriales bacterium]|nr:tyrosine-type recombinase/integrase [Eubacteriales bacterium]
MINEAKDYFTQRENEKLLNTREIVNTMPKFVREFFLYLGDKTLSLTRLNYAYDLRLFFHYLITERHADFPYDDIAELTIADMQRISAFDIEEFIHYLDIYETADDRTITNHEAGKCRKLSSLRSFFKFLFKHEYIISNPAQLVDYPHLREKVIIRLDPDEIDKLLAVVESGASLSKQQMAFHAVTKTRDVAIITLLLGTGIRVSECVGLNLSDVNFEDNSFKITRKGGNEAILYFGDEVSEALQAYLIRRLEIVPAVEADQEAFFLSIQNRRITPRSVENMVKKYARIAAPLKKITPHKLRSSYGTMLYSETGDIYLVADVLGHKDVNTTRKHYAHMEQSRRKMASEIIRLRKKDPTD